MQARRTSPSVWVAIRNALSLISQGWGTYNAISFLLNALGIGTVIAAALTLLMGIPPQPIWLLAAGASIILLTRLFLPHRSVRTTALVESLPAPAPPPPSAEDQWLRRLPAEYRAHLSERVIVTAVDCEVVIHTLAESNYFLLTFHCFNGTVFPMATTREVQGRANFGDVGHHLQPLKDAPDVTEASSPGTFSNGAAFPVKLRQFFTNAVALGITQSGGKEFAFDFGNVQVRAEAVDPVTNEHTPFTLRLPGRVTFVMPEDVNIGFQGPSRRACIQS